MTIDDKGLANFLKSFAVFTVEDDEGVRLSVCGKVIANWGEYSDEGAALLRFDAMHRELLDALPTRSSPAIPADDAGLVAALRDIYETDDHARGCEGRTYNCTCGFDDRTFATAQRAAAALSRREWQPIETAPTNRAILIHIPSRDYYGNGGVYAGMLVDMGSGRRWMTFGWAIGRDLDPGDKPSAWCEFPTPPAASQPAGGEGE